MSICGSIPGYCVYKEKTDRAMVVLYLYSNWIKHKLIAFPTLYFYVTAAYATPHAHLFFFEDGIQ